MFGLSKREVAQQFGLKFILNISGLAGEVLTRRGRFYVLAYSSGMCGFAARAGRILAPCPGERATLVSGVGYSVPHLEAVS